MKKIIKLTLICTIFSSGIVYAQEKKDDRFIEIKSYVLKTLDERKKILTKEESCVNLSKNKEDIKKCFKNANEERESFKNKEKFRK